jgi:hypothetical protein
MNRLSGWRPSLWATLAMLLVPALAAPVMIAAPAAA